MRPLRALEKSEIPCVLAARVHLRSERTAAVGISRKLTRLREKVKIATAVRRASGSI
ncbi:MAG: hypothetical protein QF805_29420 [Pirellulaceae bacterium]|jgi:hypothetical protein|nr:hypothetical protein [Pirellulaceae bacterium]